MKVAQILTLAVFVVASLAAQQTALDHAWQLVGQGRAEEAESVLRRLIEKEPRNAGARLLLGSLLTERKQPEAVIQLAEAVRLTPRSAEAENALGEAYLALSDPKSARPPLEKAVALDPQSGIAQLNLGRLQLGSGELPEAGKHLAAAAKFLKQTGEAAEAHYLLAKVFSGEDQPANAATHLQQAVELNPRFAEAWSDLGAARQLLQDDTSALQAYEHAVSLNPSDPIAQYRLGSELLRVNRAHDAAGHLNIAYRLNPLDQSTLNALQTALRRNGRTAEADQIRQRLSDLLHSRDERNQNALEAIKLNNAGAALEKTGDLKGAAEKYAAALALDPEHNGIRVNYAVALLRQGQWSEGLTQLHEAAGRDPANTQLKSALNDALAQAPPGTVPHWNEAAKQ